MVGLAFSQRTTDGQLTNKFAGRSLGVLARSAIPGGVFDMDNDDYKEGTLMHVVQGMVLQAGEKIKAL